MPGLTACIEIPVCMSKSQGWFLTLAYSILPSFFDHRGFPWLSPCSASDNLMQLPQQAKGDAMSQNQTLLVNILISEKLKISCYFGSWRAKFRKEIPKKEPGPGIDNLFSWEVFLSLNMEQEDHFLQTLEWNRISTSPPATYNRKEENYLSPHHEELKTTTIKQTERTQTNKNHFSFHCVS